MRKSLRNYQIQDRLGKGGQGEVYKAVDGKLGRTVVIKILPTELTVKESNLKRFEREARLASALDHPNICTIFDLDEEDSLHFIAMQYVEGRNVRQLTNGRPLELTTALSIAVQVADALSAAHSRGIIHRDIKANNVMVTPSGVVKVLDFGLAKLLDDESARGAGIHQTQLTEIGVPYGTATYAAPEQARGEKVDHRADIFSTGVLLYEMLTGTWPFHGKTSIDVRYAVLHDNPKPISEIRPGPVPPRLQEILDRAMAKDPHQRYQKMTELRDGLRAVMQEVSGAGQASFTAGTMKTSAPRHLSGSNPMGRAMRWLRSITGSEPPASINSTPTHASHDTHSTHTSVGGTEKKSIAILPFKNLSGDAASSFYEFSLADAVITELAGLRSLVVRPSSLIAKFQGRADDPLEIGRELTVNSILTAGFMRAGERFRVTAQLLDVQTGNLLWGDRIDATASDIITLQDTIARRIVDGLRVELSPDERVEMERPATENAAAYEEYLRGRDSFARFIFRTIAPEDCDSAIAHFQKAIRLDPNFALAYGGLGACHVNRVFKGLGSAEDFARAEEAFNKALTLDPQIIESRMLMVFVYLWRGDKLRAREEVARARREAPNEAVVHFVKATLHRLDGEHERALRSYDTLVRLDPAAHVVACYNRALVYIYLGRFDDAQAELNRAGEPDNPLVRTIRALALYYQGQIKDAVRLLEETLRQHPNMNGVRPFLAIFLAADGRTDEARAQMADEIKKNADVDPDISYALASAYALLSERDAALHWLARSISLGFENRTCFQHDPNWASLRDDEGFQELLSKTARKDKVATQSL